MTTPGQRFGRWVVVEAPTGSRANCVCDCGTERAVRTCDLLAGRSKSCGCIAIELNAARFNRHGLCSENKQLMDVYYGMVRRCYNPESHAFMDYGGRGITVCERWLASPAAFLEDMGPRPRGMSLDRKDNDKGYSPDNCRWATPKQNARNRRITTYLTCNGETLSTSDWSERSGVSARQILDRIRAGWATEKAIFTPVAKGNRWLRNKGDPP